MWRYIVTFMTTILMAAPGAVLAAEKPTFEEADKNDDKQISMEEAKQAGVPEKEFDVSDYDDDGKLNKTGWMLVDVQSSSNEEPSGKSSGTSY